MGARRHMFDTLLAPGPLNPQDRQLQKALEEVATGINSFGPCPEWPPWLMHFIAELSGATPPPTRLLECCMTGFMGLFAEGRNPDNATLCDDVLMTLGRVPLVEEHDVLMDFPWRGGASLLAASLVLNMKFLPEPALDPWWRSVSAIEDAGFRHVLLRVLDSAHPLLVTPGMSMKALFDMPDRWRSNFWAIWEWSWCLGNSRLNWDGPEIHFQFMPESRRQEMLRLLRATLTPACLDGWHAQFGRHAAQSADAASFMREHRDLVDRCFVQYELLGAPPLGGGPGGRWKRI